MTKLNDTQLILLSSASQHPDGSFYPLPATLADAGDRANKAIAALIKRGLAEEHETREQTSVHRTDGDIRYGLFITDAGTAALGTGEAIDASPAPAKIAKTSKVGAVLALLQRQGGATTSELIAETGWLPHTTRAALTGLRKKGHIIERSKRGDDTCYRIAAAA
jgi:hypothetical protein